MESESGNARCNFRAAALLFALALAASAGALAQTYGNPQTSCPLAGTTSISGTVYAPNGTDPLPNILVYVPLSAPSAFTDGPANDTSSSLVTGTPVVETTTANNGTFTLTNMPVGSNVPLVIQAGRWRRQLIVTTVTACVNTVISSSTLVGGATSRFPRTQLEGDIPKMALASGSADALECTLRKMGVADSEFTDYTLNASGAAHPGRVSLFEGAGGTSNSKSGAKAGATVHTEQTLVGSSSSTFGGSLLGSYNILLLPCQGDSTDYTTADGRSNVITFTSEGGRLFSTHLSKYYIDQNSPIDGAANWASESNPANGTATVQTGFTSGSTLAQWLQDIGSTETLGQVAISTLRLDQTGVNAPTQSWLTLNVADGEVSVPVMQFSFYTPVGASTADQYGRVMFNEYHVDNTTTSDSVTFPDECTGTMALGQAMDAQEHMLEYSLFDLMNFSVPVIVPTATIDITHAPSTFTGGDRADTITFNVTNTSESSSIATSPTVTLAISLPAGLTAVAINDPTNGWSCTLSTLTCTLATALAASSSDSVIVTVAVAANVSEGNPSVSATVSSPGFSSSVVSPITLALAIAPANTVTGPANAGFADTNVASAASATVTFAISADTTIGSIAVVTQGATGLDFTNAATGTCAAQSYESVATCTVNVNFTPTYPGLRLGAVLLEDGDGNILATTYLSGLGIGPQIAFSQPAVISPATGLNQPFGIAFDGLGNLFETDYGSGTIKKFTAASGYTTGSTLATGINTPGGMAIDGAGNLFFSSYLGGTVYESALLSTGAHATKQSIGSGFTHPFGTAVDNSGNVFVADRANNAIYEITAASGYTTTTSIGSGFNNPYSVALDLSGNVYVANGGNGTLVEITAASGYATTNTLKTITGIQSATVDANGNVYVSVRNGSTGGVFEILAASGSISPSSTIDTLVSDLVLGPEIVAVAPNGNVFYGTSAGTVISKLDYADAPSLSYSSTTVSSSSSPQSVTVENIGNGNLTFGAGGLSAPTDYIQVAGSGAPPDCAGSGTVAANATCNLSIEFHPTTTGSLSESFVLTDNSLNTEAGTQSIALSGSATAVSITLSPTTLPSGTVFNSYSQTLTANGGTGPYTYSVTGLPAGLSLATSTGRLSGSASEAGTYPLTVTATDSTDATGSQDYSLIIGQATPTIGISNIPESAVYGGSFTPSIPYNGDGTASVASNSTGICTVSGGVVHFIAAGVCSLTASATVGTNYTAVSNTVTFTIGRLTPTIAIANIPSAAIYGGNFTPSITYNGDGTSSVASNSTSICTVVSGGVHFVGVGTCSLTASATAGTNYASITGTAQTFSIAQATPTIAIANIPAAAIYGGSFTPSITYSGDGTSSAASNSTSICVVVSGVVHFVGVGTCSLTASATAGTNYAAIAGTAQTFSIAQATPTIAIANIPSAAIYGGSFTPSITYSGDGTSSVASNSTSICVVVSGVVHFVGVGTCSLTASAAAGTNYASITGTAQTFSIAQATPTIAIANIPAAAIYGGSFTPSITYSGDGTSSAASNSTSICVVVSGVVHFVGVGTCSLTASATAGTNYAAIAGTAQTFSIAQATPTIAIANIPSAAIYGGSFTPSITYNGDGTSSVASNSTSICVVVSGVVHFVGVGTCSLTASAAAGTNYAAIAGTPQTFSIAQATPTIAIANIPSAAIYGGSFTPSITYNGDGTSSAASNSISICTVVSGIVHFVGVGTCSLTASAAAGTNYAAIAGTPQTFSIAQATPTIAIANIPSTAIYGGSFTPSITYNGDGTSSAASNSTSICTVVSGIVHFVGVGTCSLTASATAGTNYASITGTAQTFTVSPASAAVTLGNLAQTYTGTPLAVTATTLPTGLTVTFTYTGTNGTTYGPSSTPPTNAGSYTVVATVSNLDYSGSATGTLVVLAPLNLNFGVSGLAFGSVPVGFTSPTLTVILTNANGSPVTITGIAASGDFSASSNCPTIAASGTCSVNVTFVPSATGARAGTLTVSNAESNSPQTIPLTGTGTQAGIQVTPVLLNFGSQAVASASTGQNITILNTGTANLLLSNVTTTGDFSTTGSCAAIPAGSNCNLTVVFTPTATGARTGTVTFTDNVGNGNQTQLVNLTGVGTVAGAQMTPSALAFPSTVVGKTSFVLNTTLTNTGTAALTGIGVTTLGDFNQTNTCAASLAPAATCIVGVKYAPSVAGAETGTLVITDNLGAQSVSLTGTGLTPGASLNTAQLVFGGQLMNTSSTAQTIVFTNTGTAAVVIASVASTADFSDTTNCTGSIAPGASCSVNVVFAPTTIGSLSGTVTIADTAGSQVVTVQGLGVSPGLAVAPSFEIFGAQVVGTISQAQTLTAQNTGTTTLILNPIVVSSNFTESDQCSAALAPGATCSISLSFSPTSTGALSGSMVVSDTTGAVATLVTLSGQGALPGISASPSTLSFGSLPVGTTSQAQTVTVSNAGSAPLQIGAVSGTGDFAETDNCAAQTIAPGSYCILNVTMTPSTTGTRTGTIQIDDNADGAHLIALSGVGQQSGVSISPTSLAFGSLPIVSSAQAASAAGTPLSVTITNTGNGPLTLGGFSTQGDFRESNSCGSAIAAGAVCTLTVTFVPTALGHRTGTLTITDNAGGGAQSVSLAGDGSPGGLTLSPPVLNYGVQTVGVTSQPQQAIMTNDTGDAIDDLVIAASGEYGQTNNCGSTLANGASCTLQITVTPVTQGAITGTITVAGALVAVSSAAAALNLTGIRNDATGSGSGLSLGVVAVSASAIPPGIGLSIPQLSFSVTAVGSPSTGQTVTLTNTGTAASLTGLTISGTNIAEFPFTTTCTATLAAQASCTITIHFTPTQMGLRVGTLNIAANGGISAAIPESGNAVTDFTISPVNASTGGASQNILPGGTANYTIAIVPTLGTSFLTPTVLSISGQPAGAVASVGTEPWTQLTSTSWQLPPNTTLQNLALSFSVPALSASAAREHTPLRTVLPILWGILLLPFAARLRRTGKRLARMLSMLLLASAGVAGIATLSGCGANNGFFGQPQQSYTIIVTATTGTLTHATQVTLTVQ